MNLFTKILSIGGLSFGLLTSAMIYSNHFQSNPTHKITFNLNKDKSDQHHKSMPTPINWCKSSESKPYPDMDKRNQNWLKVSIKKQRVFIMSPQNKVLYTMNASTGANNSTPIGTYNIQKERGNFFYNANSKEGARYWTSWKDHGVYLFHTVPTNAQGKYIKSEAAELGRTANSHGCIRLSIPDAKWINQNVPTGTKVVVQP